MKRAYKAFAAVAVAVAGSAGVWVHQQSQAHHRWINAGLLTSIKEDTFKEKNISFEGSRMIVRQDYLNNGYKKFKNLKVIYKC